MVRIQLRKQEISTKRHKLKKLAIPTKRFKLKKTTDIPLTNEEVKCAKLVENSRWYNTINYPVTNADYKLDSFNARLSAVSAIFWADFIRNKDPRIFSLKCRDPFVIMILDDGSKLGKRGRIFLSEGISEDEPKVAVAKKQTEGKEEDRGTGEKKEGIKKNKLLSKTGRRNKRKASTRKSKA